MKKYIPKTVRRILALVLSILILILVIFPTSANEYTVTTLSGEDVGSTTVLAETTETPGLTVNKTVAATTDANKFELTLDAFANSHVTVTTKPIDVIFTIDHSASMHAPVGAPDTLYARTLFDYKSNPNIITVDRKEMDTTLGQQPGYYVAQIQNKINIDGNERYWWYIIKYDPTYNSGKGAWILCRVNSTSTIVDFTKEKGDNTQNYIGDIPDHNGRKVYATASELPSDLVYYKSQYAVVYDTVLKFAKDLKATGANHRVALIGFAGSRERRTNVYVGGTYTDDPNHETESMLKNYTSMYENVNTTQARRDQLYRRALKEVQNETQYGVLLDAIHQMDHNRSFTCPSAGLKMASDLLAATNDDLAKKRERIVVLLTDGMPNSSLNAKEDTGSIADTPALLNEIVGYAKTIKDQGATVYSISTSTTGGNESEKKFLDYVSSDYPDTTSWSNPASPIVGAPKYTKEISSEQGLSAVFQEIFQRTEVTDVKLTETDVMREVLSDYVQLDSDREVQYEVFTQDYLGDDRWGELEPFDATITPISVNGRVEIINVSGFDYADEYITEGIRENPNDSSDTNYRGRKLVLKVYIETRDGFWGGNNVPTNKDTTAMYIADTINPETGETIPGKQVKPFPQPEINVPIHITVDAQNKTVYYGSTEGIKPIGAVTIGGREVTVNYDGTITPSEPWMDDFTDGGWYQTPNVDPHNTKPGECAYTVTVTPLYNGTAPRNENPSNIDGNVDGGELRDEDLTESEQTVTNTAYIYVLVPQLTFKDSTTPFGTSANGYDYTQNNLADATVIWRDMEGNRAPGEGIPFLENSAVEPQLQLTYTPDKTGEYSLIDGTFVTDTGVNVQVTANDRELTDVTTFHWQDCQHNVSNIQSHKGNENFPEFWIHVTLDIAPDTVVIDYGLDVVIDVLHNDPQTATITPTLTTISKNEDNATGSDSVKGTYGTLTIDGNKVRYQLNKENGMQMSGEETFRYQAVYTIHNQVTTLSATVTIIPATSIYYEDDYVVYSVWNRADDQPNTQEANRWQEVGDRIVTHQAQDLPGVDNLPSVDANNIYGYDDAYTDMATYSMGSAMKFTAKDGIYGTAQFTFCGTGFDIISLTSNTTGAIFVEVYRADQFETQGIYADCNRYVVDTYYGYQLVDGEWVVNPQATDALYQVPVMTISGLDYDRYTIRINVYYSSMLDHQSKGEYDFYLDSIRIYDPANNGQNSSAIQNAYLNDGECWPEYWEVRDLLISKNDFDSLKDGTGSGIVFIDNSMDTDNNVTYTIEDYVNVGPNNEVYLASGQAVAFDLAASENVAGIHLAMKTVGGKAASVQVYDAADPNKTNWIDGSVKTATDLYYNITALNNKTIVISNCSSDNTILSITNIKITHHSKQEKNTVPTYFTVSPQRVEQVLVSLEGSTPAIPEDVPPAESIPETSSPETPTPESSLPEESMPETTVPEGSVPETFPSQETIPETSVSTDSAPETMPSGEIVPETNVPEEIEQEKFEPIQFDVHLDISDAKVGPKIPVTVTTGKDVAYITVNGRKVTKYSDTPDGNTRTWQTKVKATQAGEMTIVVICYNTEGVASNAVAKTVAVTQEGAVLLDILRYMVLGLLAWFWRNLMG